uniref:Uncharacterized protein n=1 Tax=Octopus bimaculoides TaxID=37653 RepID=A0A0L8HW73_OCTBM
MGIKESGEREKCIPRIGWDYREGKSITRPGNSSSLSSNIGGMARELFSVFLPST